MPNCAGAKTIPGMASVYTHERLWWRDFCDGAMRDISHSLCARVQSEQVL